MALFPDEFSDQEVRRVWEYYVPVTTHDSSLSAGVHAIVALRLGLMEEAWKFWTMSRDLDLDFEQGGASGGIHIAAAAANWQVVVFGFAGMRSAMQSRVLQLNPRLPGKITRLVFPLVWKGQKVSVEIVPGEARVQNRSDRPLEVVVWGTACCVEPGQTAGFQG